MCYPSPLAAPLCCRGLSLRKEKATDYGLGNLSNGLFVTLETVGNLSNGPFVTLETLGNLSNGPFVTLETVGNLSNGLVETLETVGLFVPLQTARS